MVFEPVLHYIWGGRVEDTSHGRPLGDGFRQEVLAVSRVKTGLLMLVVAVSLMLLTCEQLPAAQGQTPLQVIQSGTDKALEVLHSSTGDAGPSLRERRAEILTNVDSYFDFEEMGRRALGRPWKEQPPQKQKEFVDLFKQMLFNTYVDRVQSYTATDEKVFYDSEKIDGNFASVQSRILGYKSGEVRVDYRLRLDGGQWKVYDVVVEGVSFVENYRNQFSSFLNNSTFDALLERMRQKTSQHRGS